MYVCQSNRGTSTESQPLASSPAGDRSQVEETHHQCSMLIAQEMATAPSLMFLTRPRTRAFMSAKLCGAWQSNHN